MIEVSFIGCVPYKYEKVILIENGDIFISSKYITWVIGGPPDGSNMLELGAITLIFHPGDSWNSSLKFVIWLLVFE